MQSHKRQEQTFRHVILVVPETRVHSVAPAACLRRQCHIALEMPHAQRAWHSRVGALHSGAH